ncbi:MAG: hypothetical protein ACO4CG_14850 [Prochlorothrix sp.]
MTTWNPHTPCSVGDLRLPAQFQPLPWTPFYCDTKAGHPTRGWIHLPAGLLLSWGCHVEQGEEVEVWSLGSLLLTRPMTEQERIDWEYDL